VRKSDSGGVFSPPIFVCFSLPNWCLIRVRVKDGRGEVEVSLYSRVVFCAEK